MTKSVQEFAHVLFQSPFVSICDVCCPTAFGGHEYALERDCLLFVRSGFFAARTGARRTLVDSNYIVWGSEGGTLRAMPSSKTSCTFTAIRYGEGAVPRYSRAVALCRPAAYLQHARLVNNARLANSPATIDAAAAALLFEMTASPGEPCSAGDRAGTVSQIKELLNQSIAKRISLPELADRFYLSPFTISRWFHRETGLPLRRYIQSLRLRRALTFMLDEKRSLTAIALELGFYDESHFSKAFHAEFGMPPALALTTFADTPPNRPSVERLIPD